MSVSLCLSLSVSLCGCGFAFVCLHCEAYVEGFRVLFDFCEGGCVFWSDVV